MPTASTAGMVSLNNLGGLTTTFTAPSSCITGQGFVASGIALTEEPEYMIYAVDNCEDDPDYLNDCVPYGHEISKLSETIDTREYATILNYYSPGLHCPHAWETVGVYAPGHPSNTSITTAQDPGIFSPTAFHNGRPGESTSFPYGNFFANMFTSALAPTETAVACCPSGYSVDPYAGCYTSFPITSLAEKTACIRRMTQDLDGMDQTRYTETFEFWGDTTTRTGRSIVWPTETSGVFATTTITLDESGMPYETEDLLFARPTGDSPDSALQGIGVVSPLYLVHSGSGDDGGNSDDGGNKEDEDEDQDQDGNNDDNDNNNDGDDHSAAGRLLPITSLVPIAGVLAACFWI